MRGPWVGRGRCGSRPPGPAPGRGRVAVGSPRGVRGAPSRLMPAENGPRPGRQSCGVALVPEGGFGEVRVGRKSRDPSRAVSVAPSAKRLKPFLGRARDQCGVRHSSWAFWMAPIDVLTRSIVDMVRSDRLKITKSTLTSGGEGGRWTTPILGLGGDNEAGSRWNFFEREPPWMPGGGVGAHLKGP